MRLVLRSGGNTEPLHGHWNNGDDSGWESTFLHSIDNMDYWGLIIPETSWHTERKIGVLATSMSSSVPGYRYDWIYCYYKWDKVNKHTGLSKSDTVFEQLNLMKKAFIRFIHAKLNEEEIEEWFPCGLEYLLRDL